MKSSRQQNVEEVYKEISSGRQELKDFAVNYYGKPWPEESYRSVQVALLLKESGEAHQQRVAVVFDSDSIKERFDQMRLAASNRTTQEVGLPWQAGEVRAEAAAGASGSARVAPPLLVSLKRLESASTASRSKTRVGWRSLLPTRMKVFRIVAIMLLISCLAIPLARAVATSEPGDWLYGIKTSLDHAPEWLAFSPEEQAAQKLAYAERRLTEINHVLDSGSNRDISQAVQSYQETIDQTQQLELNTQQSEWVKAQLERFQQSLSKLLENRQLKSEIKTKIEGLYEQNQVRLRKQASSQAKTSEVKRNLKPTAMPTPTASVAGQASSPTPNQPRNEAALIKPTPTPTPAATTSKPTLPPPGVEVTPRPLLKRWWLGSHKEPKHATTPGPDPLPSPGETISATRSLTPSASTSSPEATPKIRGERQVRPTPTATTPPDGAGSSEANSSNRSNPNNRAILIRKRLSWRSS